MPETDQNLEEQGYYEKETSSSYTGWRLICGECMQPKGGGQSIESSIFLMGTQYRV